MSDNYKGIDYGLGKSNVDNDTGIRYGVISQNKVTQAWCDSSEPDYGEIACPKCGNETIDDYDDDIHNKWEQSEFDCIEYACYNCSYTFGTESAYPDQPYRYTFDDDGYKATCGEDGDIFITKSLYYTNCQYCSPCAPGAGYIMNTIEPDGVKTYCFGHDWFDDTDTGKWVECDYCHGLGLKNKADILGYNEETYTANGGEIFDDNRVVCYRCRNNWQYGLQGQIRELKSIAPYPVYSVKTGELVKP